MGTILQALVKQLFETFCGMGVRLAVDQEIAELARLLVSKSESELFGASEFQVRDLVLRVGAQAFEQHLRGKKTATAVAR
jgi:hypothetical protein